MLDFGKNARKTCPNVPFAINLIILKSSSDTLSPLETVLELLDRLSLSRYPLKKRTQAFSLSWKSLRIASSSRESKDNFFLRELFFTLILFSIISFWRMSLEFGLPSSPESFTELMPEYAVEVAPNASSRYWRISGLISSNSISSTSSFDSS